MSANDHHAIAVWLGRLVAEVQTATLGRQRRGRGRPSRGIRTGYVRVETYIPADVRDALDRLADRRETRTGRSVRRSDIIRAALVMYLRKHLPEAGL
jgi:hypothetical protein